MLPRLTAATACHSITVELMYPVACGRVAYRPSGHCGAVSPLGMAECKRVLCSWLW